MIAIASLNPDLPDGCYQGRVQFTRKPSQRQARVVDERFNQLKKQYGRGTTMTLITVPGEPDRVFFPRRAGSILAALENGR